MIKLIRLDERLIHGQVAIRWSKHLGVDRIVVIDDEAAKNDLIKKSLMMAAPLDIKVAIVGMDDGIKMLADPRADSLGIMVLVKTPQNILTLINSVKGIKTVNIGNYGRVAIKTGTAVRKVFCPNLYLYDSEVLVIKKILETGVECFYQVTPDDKPEPLKKIIENS
ncbi:MAG TPA: PTS mannose/fructose/sorbose transporter subunit IIB [Clostridiales bacterium]|jgi:PTS system mannose-specific IIB component|nr:PTS mannose/fructose/sorbose transporter subunit IIB [Clostridiales bacterium]